MKKIVIALTVFVILMGWGGFSKAGHLSYGDGEAIGMLGGALIQGCAHIVATQMAIEAEKRYAPPITVIGPPTYTTPGTWWYGNLSQEDRDKLYDEFTNTYRQGGVKSWEDFLEQKRPKMPGEGPVKN